MDSIPILAVDSAEVTPKPFSIRTDMIPNNKHARNFDITFTINDGDDTRKICVVRVDESALRELDEKIAEQLYKRD